MAAQGFLLIASFLLILLVLAKPLGSGLARLIAAVPLPGVAGVERILWRTLGITDHEMNWRQYSVFTGATDAQSAGTGHPVLPAILAGVAALKSAAATGAVLGSGAEYRRQLCHQYQLASLQRRKHAELL